MIYLDNAATTPLDGDILEAMTPFLKGVFGNPSSQHAFGREANNALVAARDKTARLMGANPSEIYFTCGGTECANTAIKGVCLANRDRGNRILVSAVEHPCVIESAADMKAFGFEVDFVYPDKDGRILPSAVESAITDATVLVCVMAANNETGMINPIKEIYAICKAKNTYLYCDCVQAAGVLDLSLFPADLKGVSAHKFYGPKGAGALFVRKGVKFKRFLSGGHQESGMRAGTSNVAGAVGLAAALEKACKQAAENNEKIAALRDKFVRGALEGIEDCTLNGGRENRLPANANLSFEGCDGENILFLLDLKGIAVSTGAACSSGAVTSSPVLAAMGLDEGRVKSAVRFTFGKYNTEEEVERTLSALKEAVAKIRR